MIYTSYFAKLKELENHYITPILICNKSPKWYDGLKYEKLFPKHTHFLKKRKSYDTTYCINSYRKKVLSKLDAKIVVKDLKKLIPSRLDDIGLIFYNNSSNFCYNSLLCEWFNQNGFDCEEWIKVKNIDNLVRYLKNREKEFICKNGRVGCGASGMADGIAAAIKIVEDNAYLGWGNGEYDNGLRKIKRFVMEGKGMTYYPYGFKNAPYYSLAFSVGVREVLEWIVRYEFL